MKYLTRNTNFYKECHSVSKMNLNDYFHMILYLNEIFIPFSERIFNLAV